MKCNRTQDTEAGVGGGRPPRPWAHRLQQEGGAAFNTTRHNAERGDTPRTLATDVVS